MANEKYTNATALAAALELARATNDAELIEKLERMHATATKPRSKSKTLTAEQQQTLEMVAEFTAKLREHIANGGEPVGTDWIMANVRYCGSSQRATAVAKKAIAAGDVVKGEPVKGKVRYMVAE